MRYALSFLAFALSGFATPAALAEQTAPDCIEQTPCELGDRSYHVKPPDDWDGKTALPVMLHFHGWARQGTLIVKHARISGATRRRGVLLLAPNGRHKSWDFWAPGSDDTTFAEAVLADAAKTYPIDWDNVYVSGYSYGSAMAWRFACETKVPLRALLAVSGTIDQSETCDAAPYEVRHVHGTSDNVMDFPFGPDGDTSYAVQLWRDRLGCRDETETLSYATTERDKFDRFTWADCAEGRVTIDVHTRGHFIPRGWFAKQLDELLETRAPKS